MIKENIDSHKYFMGLSKNLIVMLSIMFLTLSMTVGCSSKDPEKVVDPIPEGIFCSDGNGARNACTSCDPGFQISTAGTIRTCAPIAGATCANGTGATADACTSCNAGYQLREGRCRQPVTISWFSTRAGTSTTVISQSLYAFAGDIIFVPPGSVVENQALLRRSVSRDVAGTATSFSQVFAGWSTVASDVAAVAGTYLIPLSVTDSTPSDTASLRLPVVVSANPQFYVNFHIAWGENFTLTYDLNGGRGLAPNITTGDAGGLVTLRSPTLTGTNNLNTPVNAVAGAAGFAGWGVNADGTGTLYPVANRVGFPSNTTLFAVWNYPVTLLCATNEAARTRDGITSPVLGTPALPTNLVVRVGQAATVPASANASCVRPGSDLVGWGIPDVGTGTATVVGTVKNNTDARLTLVPVWAQQRSADADGNGLIEIFNAEDLNNVRHSLTGASWVTVAGSTGSNYGCPATGCHGYELAANINLLTTRWGSTPAAGVTPVVGGWEPITGFASTFIGTGFTISNLFINRTDNLGLFGTTLANSSINGVHLETVAIRGANNIGAVVGNQIGGSIINSYAIRLDIGGTGAIGGFVGLSSASISNSYTGPGSISATGNQVGGFVGSLTTANGAIRNSFSWTSVSGENHVGGFAGQTAANTHIVAAYSVGRVNSTVAASTGVGKFFGTNAGTLAGCYSSSGITVVVGSPATQTGVTDLTGALLNTSGATGPANLGTACFTIGNAADLTPRVHSIAGGVCSSTVLAGPNGRE